VPGRVTEEAKQVIYIAIPVHDEENTIGVLMWKIRNIMGEFGRDYEILVHDDASTDGTRDVLQRYRRSLPLRVSHSDERLGYAGSMEVLLRRAVDRAPYPKRDAVVTLQGDFTEHPEHLVPLVKTLEGGADLVAGTLDRQEDGFPWQVRLTRWAAPKILGSTLDGCPVRDPFSGFRVYRIIVLKKALRESDEKPLMQRPGWAANLELLELAVHHARRVEEVEVELRYDIRTRKSRFRPVGTLRELARMRKQVSWLQEESAS
jgi:glycosyltransferase involved in cell wall biosynthesis